MPIADWRVVSAVKTKRAPDARTQAGNADKWQDIALCVWSIGYNLRNCDGKDKYVDMLFDYLTIEPDWDKINYYILLDEPF